jgi:hydrogenase nickel incorporation protein HypA/HybF
MHELSLAGSILEIVEAAARREAFSRVRSLHLSVPALAGVEVEALRFALQAVSPRTLLDGADLVLDEPASPARCLDCDGRFEARAHDQGCPRCGGHRWQATDGAGLRVVDLLVE